jgi:outer membrane lipoprotein-sorting protein
MKKIIIFVIILALFGIGAWVLMGGKKEVPPGEGVATPGPGGEEESSLTEILGKTKDITSFKYDMVVTAPGQEAASTTKMWFKGQKTRMEMTSGGKNMVYLIDTGEQQAYMYFPSDNTAMKMDLSAAQEAAGESPTEQSESLTDYNPLIVGSEVLDGKDCLVVKYTAGTEEVKMWIWKDYGLTIKTESKTPEGTSTTELKNIEFGDIADSMFELPAGVQIMEMPSGF